MNPLSDLKILHSWEQNVSPWIKAISDNEIDSRITTTNEAIITQILAQAPISVIDIGCGEGWLVNSLASKGIEAMGIDAIPAFIEYANQNRKGKYQVISYENLDSQLIQQQFDLAVCNFSLLGKESTELVFNQIPKLITPTGGFLVQTIHPCFGQGEQPYVKGWRNGNWRGFNTDFTDPAPWYFRTLSAWSALFKNNGLCIKHIYEPKNKITNQTASIIFYAELAN